MKKDIGYLAGIIDSEGCLHMRKNTNCSGIRGLLKIEMKDPRPLKYVAETIRLLSGKKPKLSFCGSNKSYSISISGMNQLKRLLLRVGPYLVGKQLEAGLLLHGLVTKDPEIINLLKWLKRNPEPSPQWEGAETGRSKLNEVEKGWLAGMIDGDGFIGSKPPEIKLDNTNINTVRFFKQLIDRLVPGYNTRIKIRKFNNLKWRDVYICRTRKRSVIDEIVNATYSHLIEKLQNAISAVLSNRHNFNN